MTNIGQEMQLEIYRGAAIQGASNQLPVSFEEWEQRARAALPDGPFWYVAGGAGGGDTMRANREAFERRRIRPLMARDVTGRDIGVTLFGARYPAPFLLAPLGVQGILHPEGELATARAAARMGVPFILSNVSSFTIEQVAAAASSSASTTVPAGDAPRWFQLYPGKNQEVMKSAISRAETAGYTALVVTLDVGMLGWREPDLRTGYLPFLQAEGVANYFSDPAFRALLAKPPEEDPRPAVMLMLSLFTNPRLTWDDVEWIKHATKLPLLVKGILTGRDAAAAIDHGADGVIVSNHGGRQVDGAIASLDALPEVCDQVKDRVPVLFDSGVRRGPDVLKAVALGATAVLIGRPFAYALASEGEAGVRHVIRTLMADVDITLALSGRTSVEDLDRTLLEKD
ncbi:MAG TPA: alpha-hydroxy-acid oxidizing protein [Gemmatimonadaceae bacterium]|nr:alpha-hydroxy-acid oxidizing protein [Gemmatimonadaceae bacterium]